MAKDDYFLNCIFSRSKGSFVCVRCKHMITVLTLHMIYLIIFLARHMISMYHDSYISRVLNNIRGSYLIRATYIKSTCGISTCYIIFNIVLYSHLARLWLSPMALWWCWACLIFKGFKLLQDLS